MMGAGCGGLRDASWRWRPSRTPARPSGAADSPRDLLKARGLKQVGSTYVLAVGERGSEEDDGAEGTPQSTDPRGTTSGELGASGRG